jgi:hypothetical protein
MNKEPKEVDWSKQKPGTIGVTRDCMAIEFIGARDNLACFYEEDLGFVSRFTNGKSYHGKQSNDILLPWESCIAEGHNPDGLTNAQVGEGWRLIEHHSDTPDSRVQYYSHDKKTWFNRDHESGPYLYGGTYRVPITPPVAKVPVGKATKRVPCGPEHFPPGTVVHAGNPLYHSPVGVYSGGIRCPDTGNSYDWSTFMTHTYADWRRSTDFGKTWLPCYVEVEA